MSSITALSLSAWNKPRKRYLFPRCTGHSSTNIFDFRITFERNSSNEWNWGACKEAKFKQTLHTLIPKII